MNRIRNLWKSPLGKLIILGLGGLLLACCLLIAFLPGDELSDADIQNTAIAEALNPSAATPSPVSPAPAGGLETGEVPAQQGMGVEDAAQKYVDEYGGALDAYIEILSSDDCVFLQEKFDIAAANNDREEPGTAAFQWTLGFMKASDEHMREIGCY